MKEHGTVTPSRLNADPGRDTRTHDHADAWHRHVIGLWFLYGWGPLFYTAVAACYPQRHETGNNHQHQEGRHSWMTPGH